jgi:hypothetical protein
VGSNTGGHDHGLLASRPFGTLTPSQSPETYLPIGPAGSSFTYEASEISQTVQMTISGNDPKGNPLQPVILSINVQSPGSSGWEPLSNQYMNVIINGAD